MSKENPPPYSGPPPPGFHAPPGPTYPPPPQPQHTVIVTQTVAPLILGPTPCTLTCPSCHAEITTTVETKPSTKTHLFAMLLCFFGGLLCCWIPYCVDSCQDKVHNCPNCHAYLGTYTND